MDPTDARLGEAVKGLFAAAQASASAGSVRPRRRLRWPLLITLQLATAAAVAGIVIVALRLHQNAPTAPPVRPAVSLPSVTSPPLPSGTPAPTAVPSTPLVLPAAPPCPETPPSGVPTTDESCVPAAVVAFSPAGVGLAVDSSGSAYGATPTGMRLIRSVDGGRTWTTVARGAAVTDLQWIDDVTAELATADGLFRSDDAGATWHLTSTARLNRVRFVSRSLGLAVTADGRLVRTTDGGSSFSGANTGLAVAAVEFLPGGQAWVAGPAGIAASADYGVSWTRQRTFTASNQSLNPQAPFAGWVVHIHFSDPLHGAVLYRSAATVSNQDGALFYRTANGGAYWTVQFSDGYIPNPTNDHGSGHEPTADVNPDFVVSGPSSVTFLASQDVSVPMHFSACASRDAGVTSSCVALPGFAAGYALPADVTWWSGTEWVIADAGGSGTGPFDVLESTDGGSHWTVRYSG